MERLGANRRESPAVHTQHASAEAMSPGGELIVQARDMLRSALPDCLRLPA